MKPALSNMTFHSLKKKNNKRGRGKLQDGEGAKWERVGIFFEEQVSVTQAKDARSLNRRNDFLGLMTSRCGGG